MDSTEDTIVIAGVAAVSLVVLLAMVAGILGWRCRKREPGLLDDFEMVCITRVNDGFTLAAIE